MKDVSTPTDRIASGTRAQTGQTVWDASLSGFGARRQKGDAISYVLYYRTGEGRQRWYTIGRHGAPWTPESAREEAKRLLGDVAHKSDPAGEKRTARSAQTVSELCDLYLADAIDGRLVTRRRAPKKASTLATDRGRIERHIKPLLGRERSPASPERMSRASCTMLQRGKPPARPKPSRAGWRMCAVAGALLPERWACWAQFSPMRCGTGCAPIIRHMASCGRRRQA